MTKLFVTLPALALVVALSSSAVADNGINEATLADMGLAGIELMDDSEAMQVRGLGYNGVSFAGVEGGDEHSGAKAGTLDGFIAEGKFMASGEHYSEAGLTKVESHELQVKGQPATLEIKTKSIKVFAGGFATASSL
mgnify:CR=1 FL=1